MGQFLQDLKCLAVQCLLNFSLSFLKLFHKSLQNLRITLISISSILIDYLKFQ